MDVASLREAQIPSVGIRRTAGVVRDGWANEAGNDAESKLLWNELEGVWFCADLRSSDGPRYPDSDQARPEQDVTEMPPVLSSN